MNKLFIFLLLIAVSFFVSFGLGSNIEARKDQSAPINPTATPTPTPLAEIEKLELDRGEVLIPCPPNDLPKDNLSLCYNDNGLIIVKTSVKNPQNVDLSYNYTISGGRIIGEGENVTWDLKGSRPKTYTIAVTIKGKRGVSNETKTQTITVRECECPYICSCPTLDVSGGGNIKAGETVDFTANVSGGTTTDINYNWTVSQGEIIEGQGTSTITVKTTKEMTGIIKATVEIDSDGLCALCLRTESKTATLIK